MARTLIYHSVEPGNLDNPATWGGFNLQPEDNVIFPDTALVDVTLGLDQSDIKLGRVQIHKNCPINFATGGAHMIMSCDSFECHGSGNLFLSEGANYGTQKLVINTTGSATIGAVVGNGAFDRIQLFNGDVTLDATLEELALLELSFFEDVAGANVTIESALINLIRQDTGTINNKAEVGRLELNEGTYTHNSSTTNGIDLAELCGGFFVYNSDATIGDLQVRRGANADFSNNARPMTITNRDVWPGATYKDVEERVTTITGGKLLDRITTG